MLCVETKVCSLARNVDLLDTCPESTTCGFWEWPDGEEGGRCGIERLGLDHLGAAVSRFLLDRRGLQSSRAELPVLPHLPGF
jgi:hypothetical protein